MWNNKKKQLEIPNMRNAPKASKKGDPRVRKQDNRYSLSSPQLPNIDIRHDTSTPVQLLCTSQSVLSRTSSPIPPNKDSTPVSFSPPEEFRSPPSPILHLPTMTTSKPQDRKKKKKPKLPRVKIYHPKKSDKRKPTKRAKTNANSAVPVPVSSEEAPLSKRRRVRENASGKRGGETEEGTADQFPCKSVKVVGGAMIDLRVIYKSESASWNKTGDINYSVGTVTEQFKWGLLEVLGGGVKPTSLSKDWMVFHLMSGSVEIYLDSQLIGSLDKVGDTFLVPPESTYEFHNSDNLTASLTYMIIILT